MSNESPNTECGRLNPWRASLFLAAGVAMAANGVLTVVKETVAPVKGLLSSLGGHHWPGQAIVLLVLLPVLAGSSMAPAWGTSWRPTRAGSA